MWGVGGRRVPALFREDITHLLTQGISVLPCAPVVFDGDVALWRPSCGRTARPSSSVRTIMSPVSLRYYLSLVHLHSHLLQLMSDMTFLAFARQSCCPRPRTTRRASARSSATRPSPRPCAR